MPTLGSARNLSSSAWLSSGNFSSNSIITSTYLIIQIKGDSGHFVGNFNEFYNNPRTIVTAHMKQNWVNSGSGVVNFHWAFNLHIIFRGVSSNFSSWTSIDIGFMHNWYSSVLPLFENISKNPFFDSFGGETSYFQSEKKNSIVSNNIYFWYF